MVVIPILTISHLSFLSSLSLSCLPLLHYSISLLLLELALLSFLLLLGLALPSSLLLLGLALLFSLLLLRLAFLSSLFLSQIGHCFSLLCSSRTVYVIISPISHLSLLSSFSLSLSCLPLLQYSISSLLLGWLGLYFSLLYFFCPIFFPLK